MQAFNQERKDADSDSSKETKPTISQTTPLPCSTDELQDLQRLLVLPVSKADQKRVKTELRN
jgi:hypothetical protein